MDTDNPFAATPLDDAAERSSLKEQQEDLSLMAIAKQTFLAWEKMRLIYNGVLIVFTLAMALLSFGLGVLKIGHFWTLCIPGAVVVNLCYFAGPLTDTYISWLGFRSNGLRWTLFCLGILAGMFLAIGGIAALSFSVFVNID